MENKENVSSTRMRQAQRRRERITEAAMELFQEKCVEDTSMEEVAKHAGVGAATLYRYFSTKMELVIETAEVYWEKTAEKYVKELEKDGSAVTGYEQIEKIMDIFYQIYQKEKPFLKFLQEFDVFVKKYQISEERLEHYESGIMRLKPYVTAALERGVSDESLSFHCSVDEMYYSLTHTLLALMEKLAVGGDILASDQEVEGQKQIRVITELLLCGMKNEEKAIRKMQEV